MSETASAVGGQTGRPLYIFLDEGGNFDFSALGTRYFVLTAVTTTRPFRWDTPLMALKYDELERGSTAEYFHASEDKQIVRSRVFEIIAGCLEDARLDSIIVPQAKIVPPLRTEERFYARMLGYLLRYVVERERTADASEVIVMTDVIPVRAKRKAIQKAVEETLGRMLPDDMPYRTLHHELKSCVGLQVADYCNWAIYRRWDRGDERSYSVVQSAIRSEFEIFHATKRTYY